LVVSCFQEHNPEGKYPIIVSLKPKEMDCIPYITSSIEAEILYNNPEGCIMAKAHKGKGKTKILCQLLKDLKRSEKRGLAIGCRQTFDTTICQRLNDAGLDFNSYLDYKEPLLHDIPDGKLVNNL